MLPRIAAIVVRPRRTWNDIASDPTPIAAVVAVLLVFALLPSAAVATGLTVFDMRWSPIHGYRPVGAPLTVGATGYAMTVLTILLLAAILHWLAVPPGTSRKPFVFALNVAVYGALPAMMAGALLVLPVLVIVMLVAGFHSLVLYTGGIQQVLGVRPDESAMLVAMSIVMLSLAATVIGAVAAAIGVV